MKHSVRGSACFPLLHPHRTHTHTLAFYYTTHTLSPAAVLTRMEPGNTTTERNSIPHQQLMNRGGAGCQTAHGMLLDNVITPSSTPLPLQYLHCYPLCSAVPLVYLEERYYLSWVTKYNRKSLRLSEHVYTKHLGLLSEPNLSMPLDERVHDPGQPTTETSHPIFT